jgi:hypothetical protein
VTRLQRVMVALAPYFHDHITPAARREAARNVMEALRVEKPRCVSDYDWDEAIDEILADH